MYSQVKKDAVLNAANALLQANNTVTTLEIKNKIRTDKATEDLYIDQQIVHDVMEEAHQAGNFAIVDDNGTYRTYSAIKVPSSLQKRKAQLKNMTQSAIAPLDITSKRGRGRPRKNPATPAIKPTYISRRKALELMQNNSGHFFTAVFVKKDGEERKMNCQYLKDQSASQLGYLKIKEPAAIKRGEKSAIKNLNLQTLKSLSIGGSHYKIR